MNVRGRDMGSFVSDAQAAVARHAPLPSGVSLEWGGEFENKQRAMARLLLVVPVALAITLVLLFNAFRSLFLALLTLANVPFALVGGVIALWAFGMPVSVAAAVGFIALIGQAALNGVLVLSAVSDLRKGGLPRRDAILRGCALRLQPVLMTGALAALGLIPAALSRAMGAETQRPIAVVIVGGTLSAALLTLVVLPVMYDLLAGFAERLQPGMSTKGRYRAWLGRALPRSSAGAQGPSRCPADDAASCKTPDCKAHDLAPPGDVDRDVA
jgi:heavy metal efflux system protein